MSTTVLERHKDGVFYFRYYVSETEHYAIAVSEMQARYARVGDLEFTDDATLEQRAELLATLSGRDIHARAYPLTVSKEHGIFRLST